MFSRGPANHAFWSRYLAVFDEVVVLARATAGGVQGGVQADPQQRADGSGVIFRALPDHTGPRQYLSVRREAQQIARLAVVECDVFLLRMPGLVSQLLSREIARLKLPYAVQVVGDPWDALGPGTWPGIFRPVFRIAATLQMKRICKSAVAVSYVTTAALQRRYPPSGTAFTIGFSDVMIEDNFIPENILAKKHQRLRSMPWNDSRNTSPFTIGFIGSFSQLYKAPDVLLRALASCHTRLNFHLRMVGDGRHLNAMKSLAEKLDLASRVEFLGHLPANSISDFLDSIDLFVLPSRAEGLPRALLEAMYRACPCVGTAVGGIPELLDPSDLVPVGNSERLAQLILQVASDSERLLAMSARNLAKAQNFAPAALHESRLAFLEAVKHRSSAG